MTDQKEVILFFNLLISNLEHNLFWSNLGLPLVCQCTTVRSNPPVLYRITPNPASWYRTLCLKTVWRYKTNLELNTRSYIYCMKLAPFLFFEYSKLFCLHIFPLFSWISKKKIKLKIQLQVHFSERSSCKEHDVTYKSIYLHRGSPFHSTDERQCLKCVYSYLSPLIKINWRVTLSFLVIFFDCMVWFFFFCKCPDPYFRHS